MYPPSRLWPCCRIDRTGRTNTNRNENILYALSACQRQYRLNTTSILLQELTEEAKSRSSYYAETQHQPIVTPAYQLSPSRHSSCLPEISFAGAGGTYSEQSDSGQHTPVLWRCEAVNDGFCVTLRLRRVAIVDGDGLAFGGHGDVGWES